MTAPPRLLASLSLKAREALASEIRSLTGSSAGPPLAFLQPPGQAGLFEPDSVTWKVHAHLVSMLVGGLSSLLIQAMHPSALAGVWDHSNFRQDLRARLGRTAYFIGATTFGSRDMALRAIAHVNQIHAQVTGTRTDGAPYDARDPHLLRWVHLGEVLSFVQAYTVFGDTGMPLFAKNQYIWEMQRIGSALGATELPNTLAQAQAMLLSYRDELVVDQRVHAVVELIENFPARRRDLPLIKAVIGSAFDLLPAWVLADLGRPRAPAWQQQLRQQALRTASLPLQWALSTHGVAAYARKRLAARTTVAD
jgi:uncharacterized protein (DUF2236 family)